MVKGSAAGTHRVLQGWGVGVLSGNGSAPARQKLYLSLKRAL